MSSTPALKNRVKTLRLARGWSQDELARRSSLSRSGVSAIEIDRLAPSAAAAMALARAFGCSFEEVFFLDVGGDSAVLWAATPEKVPCRYWQAAVGGRRVLYPSQTLGDFIAPHDGIFDGAKLKETRPGEGAESLAATLVVASCDPAVGLLASELARVRQIRLLALPMSSSAALEALGRGVVHAAGVHWAGKGDLGNEAQVRSRLGAGYQLLRAAQWQEGLALAPRHKVSTVRGALDANLRWVGRESGSGARQCLDEILHGRSSPRHEARSHRGVAEAIRCGYADAGVCVQLVSEQAGLDFVRVRQEPYDLCFSAADADDFRIQALIEIVQSATYRQLLAELPGYSSSGAGELRATEKTK